MNRTVVALLVAAGTLAASAQTPTKTPAPAAAPKSAPAATAPGTKAPATTAVPAAASSEPWVKLPPGVPAVTHGPVKTVPIVVHYEDIQAGAGADAESGKMWHLKYTGWRAADGVQFDTWADHKQPVMKDGKPEIGADGKPVMGDPKPMEIPQGVGAVIPGFDYGLAGMKIGGKRRIFIPWQLAYGTRAIPDRPDHPGIPAKSDLIFDVELVEVTEMAAPMPPRPGMAPGQAPHVAPPPPHPGASAAPGAAPGQAATPGASSQPPAPAAAPAASAAPAPATTPGQPQPK